MEMKIMTCVAWNVNYYNGDGDGGGEAGAARDGGTGACVGDWMTFSIRVRATTDCVIESYVLSLEASGSRSLARL